MSNHAIVVLSQPANDIGYLMRLPIKEGKLLKKHQV
jgi:hypothetical protein